MQHDGTALGLSFKSEGNAVAGEVYPSPWEYPLHFLIPCEYVEPKPPGEIEVVDQWQPVFINFDGNRIVALFSTPEIAISWSAENNLSSPRVGEINNDSDLQEFAKMVRDKFQWGIVDATKGNRSPGLVDFRSIECD